MAHTFGWTGVQLPLIGQGTWMIEKDSRPDAVKALQLGIDLGMTLIDTAEMYGAGRAEEIVGEAIRERRDEVFIVSKVLPSNASYHGTRRACERSLRRLRVECLDLYLLHWPGSHPIEETMRSFESLVRDGMSRYVGISNFDVDELRAAQAALANERLACNQVLYNLNNRGIERRLIPHCEDQGIAVMGYSPFGHGSLPKLDTRRGRVLRDVADRNGKTVRQVVLSFLVRTGVFAIPKSGNPEHVRENAGVLEWRLSDDDANALDRAFPAPDRDVPLGVI